MASQKGSTRFHNNLPVQTRDVVLFKGYSVHGTPMAQDREDTPLTQAHSSSQCIPCLKGFGAPGLFLLFGGEVGQRQQECTLLCLWKKNKD